MLRVKHQNQRDPIPILLLEQHPEEHPFSEIKIWLRMLLLNAQDVNVFIVSFLKVVGEISRARC